MRIHVVGLGKLGLPIALALEQAGHGISGWDTSPERLAMVRSGVRVRPSAVPEAAHEPDLGLFLSRTEMRLCRLEDAGRVDVVLVCVQTPHEPQFEGVTPLEEPPQDFDYSWLRDAVGETVEMIGEQADWDPLLVTVSTCLPGTYQKVIRPLVEGRVRYAYMPLFIAMGSVIDDFYNPEFVLCGTEDHRRCGAPWEVLDMCGRARSDGTFPQIRYMSIVSAELTKVAYNAFLGFKLMLANGIAMTCDAVNADADDVMGALRSADKRLISKAYLSPGMGDGGGCHPRDQIALSWLAEELGLDHDPYRVVIDHREAHAKWLADLLWRTSMDRGIPPVILGRAYKKNSTLTTGSHALLVAHYVATDHGYPVICTDDPLDPYPEAAYLLAMPHDHFVTADLPEGSVVIDPWNSFVPPLGVEIIRPGRRAREGSIDGETVGDAGC